MIAALASVALLAAGAVAMLRSGGSPKQVALGPGEVFLEPAATVGPEAFTDATASTLTVASVPTTTTTVATTAAVSTTAATTTTTPTGIVASSGSTPGLYGGTRNNASCDQAQMISFLGANPDKARAWTQALNGDATLQWSGGTRVEVAQIPADISELTPLVLLGDTRVTNHGYANGLPTSRPSVLQAGTAVLVDRYGVPRARCLCGNPLTRPVAIPQQTTYVGDRWPTFTPTTVVVVAPAPQPVQTFVVVDVATSTTFGRPAGSAGAQDAPAPTTTTAAATTTTAAATTTTAATTRPATTATTRPATTAATTLPPGSTVLPARNFCDAMRYYVDTGAGANFDTVDQALTYVREAFSELARLAPAEIKADLELLASWVQRVTADDVFSGTLPPDIVAAESRWIDYSKRVCGVQID